MRGNNLNLVLAGSVALAGGVFLPATASALETTPMERTVVSTATNFYNTTDLVFPTFDTSLGTLTGVKLTVSGAMTTTLTLKNTGSGISSYSVYSNVFLVVQDLNGNFKHDGGTISTFPPLSEFPVNFQLQLSGTAVTGNLAPGATLDPKNDSKSGAANTDIFTDTLVLQEFSAPGTITLKAAGISNSTLSTSGSFSTVVTGTGTVTATISYQYSAVPEAATMLLGGLAVMPILMQRRRQRGVDSSAC